MACRSRVTVWVIASLATILALAPLPARAGFDMLDDAGTRTLISNGRIKVVPAGRPLEYSLDVNGARLWLANSQSRKVWEGTVAEYCDGLRRLSIAPAKPAPAAAPVGRVLVQSTGDVTWIAGLPARKYVVLAGGRTYEDVWLTPDLAVARELNIERAAETFGAMIGCLANATGGTASSVESRPEYTTLYRLGWPLKSVVYDAPQGRPSGSMTVTKIGNAQIPEEEFTPPADYQRSSVDEVLSGR